MWRIARSLACSPVCPRMRLFLRSCFFLGFLLHSSILLAQGTFSLPSQLLVITTGFIPPSFKRATLKIRPLAFLAPTTFLIVALSFGLDQERLADSSFPCIGHVHRLSDFVPGFEVEVEFVLKVNTKLGLWNELKEPTSSVRDQRPMDSTVHGRSAIGASY